MGITRSEGGVGVGDRSCETEAVVVGEERPGSGVG